MQFHSADKAQYTAPYQPPRYEGATIIGGNGVFLSFIPFCLATALQYQSIQTALIVGTATAGGLLLFGLFMYYLEARQVWTSAQPPAPHTCGTLISLVAYNRMAHADAHVAM